MNPLDDLFDSAERFSSIKRYRRFIQPLTFWFLILATIGYWVGAPNV